MKKKKMSLLTGLLFFILGIIVFINPEVLVKTISYGLGGVLILTGAYKTLNYYIQDTNLGIVNRNEIAFGVTAIFLGIIFIFLADAIELLLRLIVGGWMIISGLNKIFKTFYSTTRNSKFYSFFIVGTFLILVGLYIIFVSNLALSIIGLFMMIYGIIDFVYCILSKNETEKMTELDFYDLSDNNETNVKDEVIVETEFVAKEKKSENKETVSEKKQKKNKKTKNKSQK